MMPDFGNRSGPFSQPLKASVYVPGSGTHREAKQTQIVFLIIAHGRESNSESLYAEAFIRCLEMIGGFRRPRSTARPSLSAPSWRSWSGEDELSMPDYNFLSTFFSHKGFRFRQIKENKRTMKPKAQPEHKTGGRDDE